MLLRRKMLKLLLGVSLCVLTLSCLVTADDQDGSASLLYCDDDIRNFSLASGKDSLLMSGIATPRVVDYHMKSKVIFWTDSNYNINKAPLWQEGGRPTVLRRGVLSYGLAVDWIHNLIYWTDHSIGVSRLDGSMARTVLKEEGTNPQAIVLNPAEGFMFWSDHGVPRKIERCNMDGTNRNVIVNTTIGIVYSLAIDFDIQRIFWVDYSNNWLCSSQFDGNHKKCILGQLKNPTSIDIYGQHVYFVTQAKGFEALHKASKVDGQGLTKVFDGKRSLRCLKLFDPSKQLEGYNVCGKNNGGCSHLCLPTSGHTFSCACPNDLNMGSDNHTCLNSDGSPATTPISTTDAPSSQLPFTVFSYNIPSNTDSAVTTPILNTNAPSSQLPFAVTQTKCSSSTETSVDGTIGYISTYEILTVVIASVTLIAVVGMWIYIRQFLTRIAANAAIPNQVQRRNCEENNLYMEASL